LFEVLRPSALVVSSCNGSMLAERVWQREDGWVSPTGWQCMAAVWRWVHFRPTYKQTWKQLSQPHGLHFHHARTVKIHLAWEAAFPQSQLEVGKGGGRPGTPPFREVTLVPPLLERSLISGQD